MPARCIESQASAAESGCRRVAGGPPVRRIDADHDVTDPLPRLDIPLASTIRYRPEGIEVSPAILGPRRREAAQRARHPTREGANVLPAETRG